MFDVKKKHKDRINKGNKVTYFPGDNHNIFVKSKRHAKYKCEGIVANYKGIDTEAQF